MFALLLNVFALLLNVYALLSNVFVLLLNVFALLSMRRYAAAFAIAEGARAEGKDVLLVLDDFTVWG